MSKMHHCDSGHVALMDVVPEELPGFFTDGIEYGAHVMWGMLKGKDG